MALLLRTGSSLIAQPLFPSAEQQTNDALSVMYNITDPVYFVLLLLVGAVLSVLDANVCLKGLTC